MILLERSFSNHNFSGIIILCKKEGKGELQGEKGEGKQGGKERGGAIVGYYAIGLCPQPYQLLGQGSILFRYRKCM